MTPRAPEPGPARRLHRGTVITAIALIAVIALVPLLQSRDHQDRGGQPGLSTVRHDLP